MRIQESGIGIKRGLKWVLRGREVKNTKESVRTDVKMQRRVIPLLTM